MNKAKTLGDMGIGATAGVLIHTILISCGLELDDEVIAMVVALIIAIAGRFGINLQQSRSKAAEHKRAYNTERFPK